MTSRTLYDGTPIPEHLRVAYHEVSDMVMETSRAGVALRALGDALSDEDTPIAPENRAGLCEAVGLIGENLERYAQGRSSMVEMLAKEAQEQKKTAVHQLDHNEELA